MAQNNSKNTYGIKDMVKVGGIKGNVSKSKVGYFDWFKKSGWKKFGLAVAVLSFVGFLRTEMVESSKRQNRSEAKTIIEQGIIPEKSVKDNLFRSKAKSQFGQSMMKDEKLE